MAHKVTAWQCDFCNRYRLTKASIIRHEQICFQNPNRKIPEGQLAIFDTMPRELLITNSYGVPDSDWQEPNWAPSPELSKKYKWWPREDNGILGLGYVYHGGWKKIEGYKPPHFAPGFSWKDEYVPDYLKSLKRSEN